MEPLTTQLVSELLPKLHAAFPRTIGRDNIVMMADVYRNGLRGVSGDALRAAVDRVIQEDVYFPKVSRLRELAEAWQRHNRPSFEPARRDVPWDECPVCGAKALPRMITRLRRDPNKRYAIVRDAHGAPIWEDVQSTMLYMDHDPAKHHVAPEREA